MFKIEIKGSKAFLKSFHMQFSDLKIPVTSRDISKKLKNSYIIKTDISQKLSHGSFSNFDKS